MRCTLELLTKRLGLAARTAYTQMKQFVPAAADLARQQINPPHFFSMEDNPRCPHCKATLRLLARLRIVRLETTPERERARKALLKKLSLHPEPFAVVEHKATTHDLFFERLGLWRQRLNFDNEAWLHEAGLLYLRRTEPGLDSEALRETTPLKLALFQQMAEPWKLVGRTLGLSTLLYGDILLVQYLLSRSHHSGGMTLAGRLTLFDLFHTLRRIGYVRARQIEEPDPSVLLEKLVDAIANARAVKVTYIIDRTDYLLQIEAAYRRLKAK